MHDEIKNPLIFDIHLVGMDEMYHLVVDPYENNNLLNGTLSTIEQNAKSELEAELINIRN